MDRSRSGRLALGVAICAVMLVAAGCAKKDAGTSTGDGDSGDLSLTIASPTDNASVSEPFNLQLASSVVLGDPSTGEHHVHLCFDDTACDSGYTVVTTDSVPVTTLPAGEHTITVSLRNADHSSAGPSATITIAVTGGAATGSATASPTSGGGYYH